MLNSLSVKSKLFTLVCTVIVGFFVIVGISYNNGKNLSSGSTEMFEKAVVPLSIFGTMNGDLTQMRLAFYQMKSGVTTIAEYRAKFNELYKNIEKGNAEFANVITKEKDISEHKSFTADLASYADYKEKYLKALESKNDAEADRILKQEWAPMGKKIMDKVNSYMASHKQEASEIAVKNNSSASSANIVIFVVSLAIGAIVLLVSYLIMRSIVDALFKTQTGLVAFFDFLNRQSNDVRHIAIDTKDEFGEMAKVINQNIDKTQRSIVQDAKVIEILNETASFSGMGLLSFRIHEKAVSPDLQKAVEAVNSMLDRIENAMDMVVATLIEYANANYTHSFDSKDYAGQVGSMIATLKAMGSSNSDIFALIAMTGEILKVQAQTLANEAEELSTSSNEQAASLEETAAALEEMTSNVASARDKALQMADVALETKRSAEYGLSLTNRTVNAMNEIDQAATAINEAVTVIDNIAFQTNILSLNAAVEAATAGEAGKGFAVVAQEVRNLAARSADAAKQIQELASIATAKTKEGKQASMDMISGFNELNQKIAVTSDLIEDVTNASKEQMTAISQINDSVGQLDAMTQTNAASSHKVSSLAMELLNRAETLINAASKVKYDHKSRAAACDIDLIFELTQRKIDHVKFKENNYKKLKTETAAFSVVTEQHCALGKWLGVNASKYQGSAAWNKLAKAHHHVHSKVQEYINEGVLSNHDVIKLQTLAKEIENDTIEVFGCLDEFKLYNCSQRRERS